MKRQMTPGTLGAEPHYKRKLKPEKPELPTLSNGCLVGVPGAVLLSNVMKTMPVAMVLVMGCVCEEWNFIR